MREAERTVDAERKTTGAAPSRRRGFAAMDPAYVRELASRGGKAAHEQGTAHEFTPEEAREAGRKGGTAAHRPRRVRDKGSVASVANDRKRG